MNSFDILVGSLLIIAAWRGWKTGILRQLSSIAAIIAGTWAAYNLSTNVKEWFAIQNVDDNIILISILVIVMISVIVILNLLSKMLFSTVLSTPIKTLGAICAIIKCLLMLSLIITIYARFNKHIKPARRPQIFNESWSYESLHKIGHLAYPYLEKSLNNNPKNVS